ncbi:MAG: hypothetical protein WA125_12675 [Desulfosporosinus sp.]
MQLWTLVFKPKIRNLTSILSICLLVFSLLWIAFPQPASALDENCPMSYPPPTTTLTSSTLAAVQKLALKTITLIDGEGIITAVQNSAIRAAMK